MVIGALALILMAVVSAPAVAGTPTQELKAMVAEVNGALTDAATDGRPRERVSAVLDLIERRFAFTDAAAAALGAPWRRLAPAEQAVFVDLFAEVVERAFVMALATKARTDGGFDVSYRSESITGDDATVLTTVVARSGRDLPLGYRMSRRGDSWLITDVVLDGISLVDSYRAQLKHVLRTSSWQELVARMQAMRLEVPEWWPESRLTRRREAPAEAPVVVATAAPAPIEPQTPPAPPAVAEKVASPPPVAPQEPRTTPTYWLQAGAFRVKVGPFPNVGAAVAALVELHRHGYEALLSIER